MTGFMMILPLLPLYGQQLGFSEFQIGLLVASFFIGRVLLQFPLGVLSDHIGRRHIIWSALLLFSLSTAAYALTDRFALMTLLRAVQGVASSAFVVGSQSYVNDRTPTQLRGLANGVMSSAINVGVIVGPVIGGIMSQAYSIRAPFLAGGGLGLVCFFLTLVIPRPERPLGPAPEWSEMLPQLSRLRRLMNAVLCLPCFSLSLVHFLQMMGLGILITSAPVLTADKLGWSPTEIAAGLALGGLLAALLSPWLGSLSDRFGRVWVMGAGLAVMALEGAALFFHPGTVLTMTALAVGGTGAPAYFNAFYSLEGDITQPQERGAVTGFVGSFGEWGSIIGSSLLTPLLWKAVDISAPMALNAAVLTATVGITIIMKPVLERQVGRRSVKHTERPPRA